MWTTSLVALCRVVAIGVIGVVALAVAYAHFDVDRGVATGVVVVAVAGVVVCFVIIAPIVIVTFLGSLVLIFLGSLVLIFLGSLHAIDVGLQLPGFIVVYGFMNSALAGLYFRSATVLNSTFLSHFPFIVGPLLGIFGIALGLATETNIAQAAYNGDWTRVRQLVEQRGDVNVVDRDLRRTALHHAADCVNMAMCKLLLRSGAKISLMDKHGEQPLHLASLGKEASVCELLVAHGADVTAVNKKGETPLKLAVAAGYSNTCYPLITKDSVNVGDHDGNRPLHFAAGSDDIVTVQLLVDGGADTNAVNKHGQTPLHTAAGGKRDCPELCVLLIGKGAEVNAVDGNGNTSFQVALQEGNMKTAKVLLENGADCSVLNGFHETLLHLVCNAGVDMYEFCEDLIAHGASPHLTDREGYFPLHIALKNKLPKTSCFLIKHLDNFTLDDLQKLNVKDISQALCFVVNTCDAESCQKLLNLGADPDVPNTINQAQLPHQCLGGVASIHPLHIAVAKNNSELCCLLLDNGATVNVQMHKCNSTATLHLAQPLHLAVQLGFIDTSCLLIERGALINAETKKRETPLHLAVAADRKDIIQLLVSHGAVADTIKNLGSALEMSSTRETQSLALLLRDSSEQTDTVLCCIALIVVFVEAFPAEIVAQGKAAMQIYVASCSEGTAVTVFLRVDIVGRDGAGKTSLTKSLTLQEFDPDELSTRGVVFDPKCQIIVKEACDWTTPVTSEHYKDMYDKNVTAIVADKLDTPEVKHQYFRSRKGKQHRKMKPIYKSSHFTTTKKIDILTDSPQGNQINISPVDVRDSREQKLSFVSEDTNRVHQDNYESANSVAKVCDSGLCKNQFQITMVDVHSDMSSLLALPKTAKITSGNFSLSISTKSEASSMPTAAALNLPSCMGAHQRAISESTSSIDTVEKVASGTAAAFHFDAKGTGEESTVILPQGSKHARNIEPAAAVQHVQQPNKSTEERRKRKTKSKTQAAMPQSVKQRVTKFLRDRESLKKAQNELMATVLDYAGQHVFYATHQLCLSKASFYYVVFDASQPLNGKTPSVFRVRKGEIICVPLFDDETNFDRLLEWMSAIHIMEPDHSHHIMLFDEVGIASPAMFLVGTHADELREQPDLLERQDDLMKKKLEGTVLAEHIVWASKQRMCFYVDNKMTDPQNGIVDPQVHLLRQMTEEVARKVVQYHRVPLTWLKFEQEVRDVKISSKGKRTVSVEDLFDIAKKAVHISTKDQLEVLLHYLSNRAVLLYHPKALKSKEEEVILDVEWLVKQLEKVVTIHSDTDVPPKFKKDITRTVQRGIMTASLIRHLLSDCGAAQHLIVSLMNHFDLLCQYVGFEAHELLKADKERDFLCLDGSDEDRHLNDIPTAGNSDYFMPCLLEKTCPLQSQKIDATLKTLPLLLSSAPLRIPRPLFYRVLTHLCKRFPRLPDLYSNVGYFHISPDHRLEFSLNRYSFQIVILSEGQIPPRSTVCVCARNYIVNTVEKLKLEGMAGLQLHTGFRLTDTCLSVSDIPDEDDFVSLDGFPDQRVELYNSKKRQVELPPELLMWYPQLEQKVKLLFNTKS